jgi:transcription antitermination factor NusA-like protein
VHHLYVDRNLNFEQIKCKVLYVNDLNENVKFRASRKIVEHFLVKHMKIDEKDPKAKLSILIPENLCSLFIGKEGRNIKSIMSETRTQIDLHTEQYDAGYRPVDIKGDVYSITFAIEKISQSLDGFSDRSDKKADVESEGEIRYVFNREVLRTIEEHSDLLAQFGV